MSTTDKEGGNVSEDGWKLAGKQKKESTLKRGADDQGKKMKDSPWKSSSKSESSRYSKIFKNDRDSTDIKGSGVSSDKPSHQPGAHKLLSKKHEVSADVSSSSVIPIKKPTSKQLSASSKEKDAKTKNVALFDMLMTSVPVSTRHPVSSSFAVSKKASLSATTSSSKVHPNALRNLETVLLPKSFIQPLNKESKKREKTFTYQVDKVKKVKKLSVFKKKVLKERMKLHMKMEIKKEIIRKQQELREQQLQQQSSSSTSSLSLLSSLSSSSSSSLSLRIYNFTKNIDWKDELEKDEIINNVKELLSMIYDSLLSNTSSSQNNENNLTTTTTATTTTIFQFISSLSIWKWKSHHHTTHDSSEETDVELSSLISFIDIKFKTKEIIHYYYEILKNMIIAGESLYCLYSDNDNGNYVEELLKEKHYENGNEMTLSTEEVSQEITMMKEETSESSFLYTLLIENMITEDDNITNSEDVQEILNDVYSLCSMTNIVSTSSITHELPRLLWIEKRERKEKQMKEEPLEVEEEKVPFIRNYKDDKDGAEMIQDENDCDCFIVILQSIEDSLTISEKFLLNEEHEKKGGFSIAWCDYGHFNRDSSRPGSSSGGFHPDLIRDTKEFNNKKEGFYGIGFLNFLSEEEYEAEDEREEILENILSLLSSEISIEKILFVRSTATVADTEDGDNNNIEDSSTVYYSVYLLFSSIDMNSLLQQLKHLKSQIISGESLKVEAIFYPFHENSTFIDVYSVQTLRERTLLIVSSDSSQAILFRSKSFNTSLTPADEEIVNLSIHDKEVFVKQSFLSYLYHQCGELSSLQQLLLLKDSNSVTSSQKNNPTVPPVGSSVSSSDYSICLQYSSFLSATYAMSYFNNLVVGGQTITAYLDAKHHSPPSSTSHDGVGSGSVLQPSVNVLNETSETAEVSQPLNSSINEISYGSTIIQQFIHDKEHWKNYFDCAFFEFFFQPLPSCSSFSLPFLSSASLEVISPKYENQNSTQENLEEMIQENEIIVKDEDVIKRLLSEKELAEKDGKSIFTKAVTLGRIGSHATPAINTIPVSSTLSFILAGFFCYSFVF
jgi:hypothetical protein